MELTYPQKSNGLYVLSRMAIEQIATDVLKEYAPQNLEHPLPLDTRDMMENYLGLIVKHAHIGSFNSGILGLIVMSDAAEIPSLDEMFKPTVLQECFGTVLISRTLLGNENLPRKRYTEMHEASHLLYTQCADCRTQGIPPTGIRSLSGNGNRSLERAENRNGMAGIPSRHACSRTADAVPDFYRLCPLGNPKSRHPMRVSHRFPLHKYISSPECNF